VPVQSISASRQRYLPPQDFAPGKCFVRRRPGTTSQDTTSQDTTYQDTTYQAQIKNHHRHEGCFVQTRRARKNASEEERMRNGLNREMDRLARAFDQPGQ
jgi:hypothetical protein